MESKRKILTLPLHSLVTLWLTSLLALGVSGCGSSYDENAPGRDVPAYLKADMKASRRSIPPISELDVSVVRNLDLVQGIEDVRKLFGPIPYRQWTFVEPLQKDLKGQQFSFNQIMFYKWAKVENSPSGYLTKETIGIAVFLFEGNVEEIFVHHSVDPDNPYGELQRGTYSDNPYQRSMIYPNVLDDATIYWAQWPLEARCGTVPQDVTRQEWEQLRERQRKGKKAGCYDAYKVFGRQDREE